LPSNDDRSHSNNQLPSQSKDQSPSNDFSMILEQRAKGKKPIRDVGGLSSKSLQSLRIFRTLRLTEVCILGLPHRGAISWTLPGHPMLGADITTLHLRKVSN
jgi:hypothetical protein